MKLSIRARSLRIAQYHYQAIRPLTASFSTQPAVSTTQKSKFSRETNRQFIAKRYARTMASYSNTDTGGKPADPYKEKNLDVDASIKEKVEDLSDFISKCKFGMMTTRDGTTGKLYSRCMGLAAKETGGIDLIFHTNTESGKTDDLSTDAHINIAFLNASGEWASVSGHASVVTDRDTVKKYYSAGLKAWLGDLGDGKHDGSAEDPRIGVIRVKTETATYALVRKNVAARAVDMAQGVVTGNAPQVNKLRELSVTEVETWRASSQMVQ